MVLEALESPEPHFSLSASRFLPALIRPAGLPALFCPIHTRATFTGLYIRVVGKYSFEDLDAVRYEQVPQVHPAGNEEEVPGEGRNQTGRQLQQSSLPCWGLLKVPWN